ncbi:glycophorin-A isoform X3 [Camelus dromedarius]|uniref:glycophorin-A isoform X3 n=1 Tax=Camelus dromedarius TaxID=9838 RepID=UPI0031196B01
MQRKIIIALLLSGYILTASPQTSPNTQSPAATTPSRGPAATTPGPTQGYQQVITVIVFAVMAGIIGIILLSYYLLVNIKRRASVKPSQPSRI